MSDFLTQLIEAEKAVVRAPAGAKEATWTAIEGSIAAGVMPPVDLGGSAAIAWLAGIIGAVSMLAVAGYVAVQPPSERSMVPPPPAPPPPAVVVPTEEIEIAPLKAPSRAPSKSAPPPSSLSVQIQELRKAQQAFARGSPEIALELVEAHRSKYAKTPLEQERSALEALAACRVRRADAAKLAESFLATWPKSPQADRVRRCR